MWSVNTENVCVWKHVHWRQGGRTEKQQADPHFYRIITKNRTRFERVFTDQGNLRTWFNELIPVGNLVANNVKTSGGERKNVEIRARFICTLIKNAIDA